MNNVALSFDMGGSKLVTGLVTRRGEVLWSQKTTWSPISKQEIMTALIASGQAAMRENPNFQPQVIGATIPGVADYRTGTWLEASFSGIRDFPVASELSHAFSLPVFADNDGNACVLAEHFFGAGQGIDDFLYMTVSNGIGGGIFSGGQLLRGATGAAGEMGHCTVVDNGRLCKCGKRGCLEVYAAGPGIRQTYHELYGTDKSGEELAQMARAGDSSALHIWELEGDYLGRIIAASVNLLNPARVILGGGLSLAFPLYEAALWKSIRQNLFAKPNAALEIMPTPLGYQGGLLGAAAIAFFANQSENRSF